MPGYEWIPPRRNIEDPGKPPLPGMPGLKAPRIHPMHPLYYQAGNHEVWGELAHPDLHEHNPFLKEHDDEDYGTSGDKGQGWRQDHGGYADWEDEDDEARSGRPGTHYVEKKVQGIFDKAHPAIAISRHALNQVLYSGRLKSQFETSTSGGALNPDSRRDVEEKFFGYPHDLPDRARPIYGYLTNKPLEHHPGASGYGEHTLILHRPRIWHRTSAFLGDTLDDQYEGHSAHPVQDFRASGFHRVADPRRYSLDMSPHDEGDPAYTEAHYHGGVGLRDIHYAVLHRPDAWMMRHDSEAPRQHENLKRHLNEHKIPWVESDNGKPVDWQHHLSRLMDTMSRGAHMHQNARIIGQQGKDRYLIDLGYDNEHGHRQAQIADVERGELHPPMSKDSILARGYWEDPDTELEAHDILPLVHPV